MSHNLVRANTVQRDVDGICLDLGAENNLLIDNIAQGQEVDGIPVTGGNNLIAMNTALGNGQYDLSYCGSGNEWCTNEYETANR